MSNYEFTLNGSPNMLYSLSQKSYYPYFNVCGGINHELDCPANHNFRMTSVFCEGETDPKVIWQIGYELIDLFNGASILYAQNHKKISISTIHHDKIEMPYIPRQSDINIMGCLSIKFFSQGTLKKQTELELVNQKDVTYYLLSLAFEYDDVYHILKYLDMDASLGIYYKLLESIEYYSKQKFVALPIDKNTRKSFTNTANNYPLSGFSSRHGVNKENKPNKTPPMSLEEAYKFVTGVTKEYLGMVHSPPQPVKVFNPN